MIPKRKMDQKMSPECDFSASGFDTVTDSWD